MQGEVLGCISITPKLLNLIKAHCLQLRRDFAGFCIIYV